MISFKKASELHDHLELQRRKRTQIGFVPTMGALHAGHLSLINACVKENDLTVCSVFVNPTQFNDPKDFEKYPVTIEKDIYELETSGCNIFFLPSVSEIYPDDFQKDFKYDLGYLETILEGKFRPGHFQGVCMVMHRLMEIVGSCNLYLGQKDLQQCMVIKKLIELIGLKGIQIIISPTIREADGLAMSSRNMRLNADERKKAIAIYQELNFIKENFEKKHFTSLKREAAQILSSSGFKIDYVAIADAANLELLNEYDDKRKLVALIAAYMNEVRLIDNMVLN